MISRTMWRKRKESVISGSLCPSSVYLFICYSLLLLSPYVSFKVLRPSGPNYWKNVEWIPYVFCKEYCSEC